MRQGRKEAEELGRLHAVLQESQRTKGHCVVEDTKEPHNLGCGGRYCVPTAFLRVRRAASVHLSSPSAHWPPTFPEKLHLDQYVSCPGL